MAGAKDTIRWLDRFPDPGQASLELRPGEAGSPAEFEAQRRQLFEQLHAFWQALAPVYVEALGTALAAQDDAPQLRASIEDWPGTIEAQQYALTGLMDHSKLRQSWRSLAGWQLMQRTPFSDGQRQVSAALEREHADSATPLREIPLYRGVVRASCQQIICMPASQWESMFSDAARYDPALVDQACVNHLATRLAAIFNDPLQAATDANPQTPTVWHISPRTLLCATDSHGMRDRLFDDYLRPIDHDPERTPSWRFDGFCGQLRIEGMTEEAWYLTVLAPSHFVTQLRLLAREARDMR